MIWQPIMKADHEGYFQERDIIIFAIIFNYLLNSYENCRLEIQFISLYKQQNSPKCFAEAESMPKMFNHR